jgi:hypothetical protein
MSGILIFILNSKVHSNFLYVKVYFTLLQSSNSCYKVAWQRSSSHGLYNLLLLTFCMPYHPNIFLPFIFRILFFIGQTYF